MKLRPLTTNERAELPGSTHVCVITADDLTQTATNTAQVLTVCALNAGDSVRAFDWDLRVPFQNTGDAAFNSDTISIGDDASATQYAAAAEANANGTFVTWRTGSTVVLYTAASHILVTVNSMAAKALNNINRGELLIFFTLRRMKNVADAMASTQIAKT